MPDWIMIKDKDDNIYYIDTIGKIHTSGQPEFNYKAVSEDGINFYLNHGLELIDSENKEQGLTLLKSILAMPVNNNIIYTAQKTAAKKIEFLNKNYGIKYERLNENASLLLYKNKNKTILINDFIPYSISIPAHIEIISKRIRKKNNYIYYGISTGLVFDEDNSTNNSGYDILLAIESEKFISQINTSEQLELSWKNKLGSDTFDREILDKSLDKILYKFKDKTFPHYSGIEAFYFKNNYGYFLRLITSADIFEKNKNTIFKILKSFKI